MVHNIVRGVAHAEQRRGGVEMARRAHAQIHVLADTLPREETCGGDYVGQIFTEEEMVLR